MIFKTGRLQIHNANETAFGVAEASFSAIEVETLDRFKLKLEAGLELPQRTRQGLGAANAAPIATVRSKSTLGFDTLLSCIGSAAAAGSTIQAPASSAQAVTALMEAYLGGYARGTGTTISDVTPSATEFDVTSAAGLAAGQAVGVVVGGLVEVSTIATLVSTTVTLSRALSAAPANGAVVYGACSAYVSATEVSKQFRAFDSSGRRYDLYGCRPTCKLSELAAGSLPKLTCDTAVADYAEASESMTLATYSASSPVAPGFASVAFVGTYGASTRTPVDLLKAAVDFGVSIVPRRSVGQGVQGISGMIQTQAIPTCKLHIAQSSTWKPLLDPATRRFLHLQIGNTPGKILFLAIPSMYLKSNGDEEDQEGTLGVAYDFEGQTVSSGATEIAQSPILLAWL